MRLRERRKPWQRNLINYTISPCGVIVTEKQGRALSRSVRKSLPLSCCSEEVNQQLSFLHRLTYKEWRSIK